ncbi:TetR/AcrR family transcriptional regulator C-terminal domain-containing protein [Lactobacillus helveticus]|uniref:TetR/AcrR family transcriptional regulator C-terminal domain-containing protein n=1 Tax=Lactobacillus helveticus TaxID=1587 RepID=UPI001C26731C|nr:TetR/AcrR family transcriptional regulator C-terminal domain-containing protein [Lactobacillus helveticus]
MILADPAFKNTLHFCDKYKRTLRALVSENGDILFVRKIEAVAETEFKIRAKYLAGNKNLEIQDPLFIKIYVSQIVTLIENWLFFSDNISQAMLKKVIGHVQIVSPFEILQIEAKMN